jgi:hypothetical protein
VTANGRHLALTGRRGTPPDWVEMARAALGGRIELDPMSEPIFNEIVRAEVIYTESEDGLRLPWNASTVFLNPHGGLVVEAWRKLTSEWCTGRTTSAIWIGFSLEQMSLLAEEEEHPLDFSLLIARKRISFLGEDLKPLGSPTHGNYVVGIGIPADRFEAAFAGRGRFSHGRYALRAEPPSRAWEDDVFGGVA